MHEINPANSHLRELADIEIEAFPWVLRILGQTDEKSFLRWVFTYTALWEDTEMKLYFQERKSVFLIKYISITLAEPVELEAQILVANSVFSFYLIGI